MRTFILPLTLLFPVYSLFGSSIDSLENNKKSYYIGGHFAGNTGMFSVNGGQKFFKNRWAVGAGYGYLPQSVNGVRVHTVYIKNSYYFTKGIFYKKASWYTGFNTIYGITENTFVKLPSWYPEKYYAPNAIHFTPYLGVRVPFSFYQPGWANKVYFHAELGTVDSYLWYAIINKEVGFWDICNVSYGIYYDFDSSGNKNRQSRLKKSNSL